MIIEKYCIYVDCLKTLILLNEKSNKNLIDK